mmetsp:Transcript_15799/g.26866  ORF Transcript_15799/g.26866 Transcript_15799/m.26866 type:complete len:267 (+) Transcript_15799:224-1024(+)
MSYPAAVVRSGCLLVLQEGELEVDVVLCPEETAVEASSVPDTASQVLRRLTYSSSVMVELRQRIRDAISTVSPQDSGAGAGVGGKGEAVGAQRQQQPQQEAVRMRVGPGFMCYCAPASGTNTASPELFDPKQVPPTLRGLPRLVRATHATPPQKEHATPPPRPTTTTPNLIATATTTTANPKNSKGGTSTPAEGGEEEAVVTALVSGRDLAEFLRQPGMPPLRTFIHDQSTANNSISADSGGGSGSTPRDIAATTRRPREGNAISK